MDRRAFIRAVATAAGASATMGALSACGSSLTTPTAAVPSTAPLASTEIGKELRTVLDSHGITGATIREVIDSFDALPGERPLAITASVSPMLVSISDATSQFAVSLADQPFYLSLAPYRTYTHPCRDHSLGGCQGELPDTDLHVLIESDSGDILVDADATTYANGFAGFWVARDHKGTVTVTTENERATASFDSSTNGATCLADGVCHPVAAHMAITDAVRIAYCVGIAYTVRIAYPVRLNYRVRCSLGPSPLSAELSRPQRP